VPGIAAVTISPAWSFYLSPTWWLDGVLVWVMVRSREEVFNETDQRAAFFFVPLIQAFVLLLEGHGTLLFFSRYQR
jgi:hypothetical protein